MPLAQPPENATPDQIAKTEAIRQKMLRLAQEKYLFGVQDRRIATGLLVEDGRLVGLKIAGTTVKGRRAEPLAGSEYQLRAPMVISSIGSVPEKIPGIAMKNEYYDFNNESLPRYGESDDVFGAGNVVTGQGNIRSSLLHSQEVTTKLQLASRTRAQCPRGFTRARKPEERRKPRLFGIECRSCEVCHTTKSRRSSRGFGPFKSE
jgi:hypothetical protein